MDLVNETGFEAAWIIGKIDSPRFALTAIVKGTFRLRPDEAAIRVDEQLPLTGDLFDSDDPARPLRYPMDFAPFKPRADVLLVGTCHTPDSTPASFVPVTFQIGQRVKSALVFGDRHWSGRAVTKPLPFTALPLSWERAFGGPVFAENPLGRGAVPSGEEPVERLLLPNLESPDRLIRKPSDNPAPVGFGPIPDAWPQRLRRCGTFDDRYLKERWPWPPVDLDWAFFNAASEDQQVDGYLKGDEPLVMENLHVGIPLYRSRLPGLRVRCFLNEHTRADFRLREFNTFLDTSWIDMDSETLVLVWRGHTEVSGPELMEAAHLFLITESLDSPPADLRRCSRLLAEALSRREMEDDELEPEEEAAEDSEDDSDTESLDAAGDGGGSTEAPSGENAAPEDAQAQDGNDVPAPPDETPLTAERVRDMAAAGASFAGVDLSSLRLTGFDLRGVDFREAILTGADLTRANLARANLTGAVLAGANLREANCETAMFAEADLTGSWLTRASLQGANVEGADFSGARLHSADLRGVNGANAIFAEADLTDATLEEAMLTAADFCDARLHRTNFSHANLSEAAFEHAWGRHIRASGATLVKVRGAEAILCDADFHGSIADQSVWETAHMVGADLSSSSLNGAEFSGAYLEHARLDATDMKQVRLNQATLRGAQMRRSNLFEATLDEADLTGATLSESNLFGATLVDSLREGTEFTNANLRRIKSRESIG